MTCPSLGLVIDFQFDGITAGWHLRETSTLRLCYGLVVLPTNPVTGKPVGGPRRAWNAYVTHRIAKRCVVKLDYIHYDYEYSGSGWQLGGPKDLADASSVLGFPTYDSADKVALSFMARF